MPTLKNGSSCILIVGDEEVQAGGTFELPEELKEFVVTIKEEKMGYMAQCCAPCNVCYGPCKPYLGTCMGPLMKCKAALMGKTADSGFEYKKWAYDDWDKKKPACACPLAGFVVHFDFSCCAPCFKCCNPCFNCFKWCKINCCPPKCCKGLKCCSRPKCPCPKCSCPKCPCPKCPKCPSCSCCKAIGCQLPCCHWTCLYFPKCIPACVFCHNEFVAADENFLIRYKNGGAPKIATMTRDD